MKFVRNYTVAELAELIDCKFVGNAGHIVSGINEIHRVVPGDLVFVDHPKYYQKALNSAATTVLIDQEVDCPEGKALIISATPFDHFNQITRHFKPFQYQNESVGEGCSIAKTAQIFPNVFVGNRVKIGENVILYPGVVIGDDCVLEDNVVVGSNSVIGHYAFYYKKKAAGFDRLHSCGSVILKRNVEIGALCTIDAGVSAETIIGEGTKIDNQVHVGHDTVIGKNCLFAANVGLAGCVTIEDDVTMWGQVGCASDLVIGQGAVILAQSGIGKSLPGGKTYFGSPCGEVKTKFRELAAIKRLPSILENL